MIFLDFKEGNTLTLSGLPSKIQLEVTGIIAVEKKIDDVLRHDGNYDLSKILMPAAAAQKNLEKKIKQSQKQAKSHNARKSDHHVKLEKLVLSSNKRKEINVVSPVTSK